MSHSTLHLANTLLERSFTDQAPMNVTRLQRILFLIECEYRQLSGGTLLGDRWAVFASGPAVWHLHHKCECLGGKPLRRYLKDAAGNSHVVAGDPELSAAMERVWPRTEQVSTADLSHITRLPGSPWNIARDHGEPFLDDHDVDDWTEYRNVLGIPYPLRRTGTRAAL